MAMMMDVSSWMFILVMSIGCSVACTVIAHAKGYRGSQLSGWFAAGLFFSVFALIAVILTSHGHAVPQEGGHVGVCPRCGVPFPSGSSRCTNCGTKIAAPH